VLRDARLYDKVAHSGWDGSCLLPTRGEGICFPCGPRRCAESMYDEVWMVLEEGDKALSNGTGRSEYADLDDFFLWDCVVH
jgi:hypothetical protein